MPPPVEQQLDLPVIEIIGDESIEFPRLDMDDLMRWANEARAARLKEAELRYSADKKLDAYDRHRLLQGIADEGLQLGWLLGKAYEPAGIRKALVLSLKKRGLDDAAVLAVLKRIHFIRQLAIAREVLSPPPTPAKEEPKGQSDEGFTGIGSETPRSSESTSDGSPVD